MIDITIDSRGFENAVADFARVSRKDLDETMKKQAAILVGTVIAITPPGEKRGATINDRGGIELEAKKRGESKIASDIAKLFPTTRAREEEVSGWIRAGVKAQVGDGRRYHVRDKAFTEARLASIHQLARNRTSGRTLTNGGANMAYTRSAILKAYIRKEIKKVGLLNAGWVNAGRRLGTASRAMPAWITRHGAKPGSATITKGRISTSITLANNQDWFPSGMASRVKIALDRREAGMKRAMQAMIDRNAERMNRRR